MLPFLLLAPINLNFQAWQTQLNNWHRDKWFLKDKVQLSLPQDSFYFFFFYPSPQILLWKSWKSTAFSPSNKGTGFPCGFSGIFFHKKIPCDMAAFIQTGSKLGAGKNAASPKRPEKKLLSSQHPLQPPNKQHSAQTLQHCKGTGEQRDLKHGLDHSKWSQHWWFGGFLFFFFLLPQAVWPRLDLNLWGQCFDTNI